MANLADLFAEIWLILQQRIDELRALDDQDAAGMATDLVSVKAEATELMGLAIDRVADLRAWAGHDISKLLLAAQVIDEWYAPLACRLAESTEELDAAHKEAQQLFVSNDRLNENEALGQVILRRPLWGRWSDSPRPPSEDALELSHLFDTLMLLPNRILATLPDEPKKKRKIAFRFRRRMAAEVRPLRDAVWKIGFAPLVQAEEELEITYPRLHGRLAYDVQVAMLDQRLNDVIEMLCKENCHIIALPEMALHGEALESLRAAVKKHGEASKLVLVLAGTRRVPSGPGKPPFNEAVVLDHLGEEVMRQRKLARWNLNDCLCERYGLPKAEGGILYEYITPGDEIVVIEQQGFGRLAVLVCEDLNRTEPGRWIRSNLPLELQFTPVLDGSLAPERWTMKSGSAAARSGGCRVLVANSLPLTLRCNRVNKHDPQWIVKHCGIGLGIDVSENQARYKISSVLLDTRGDLVTTLAWEVEDWDVLRSDPLQVDGSASGTEAS